MSFTRAQAWDLLVEWTSSQSLRKHALAVEAALRYYARLNRLGPQEEELWGNTGLLHDFDYERFPSPSDHPSKGLEVLRKQDWPTEMLEAIAGHAQYLNVPRVSLLAKTLFAVDELSGLIVATAYVQPNHTLAEVSVDSILRKLKKKEFAKSISREDINRGAAELGIPLEEHIDHCLKALQAKAEELEL